MGAVSAINFAVKNPKIVDKLVLDSPFRFLDEVIKRVIRT
jgi:pimeloyl-ACP methyl ester carboxylesterase